MTDGTTAAGYTNPDLLEVGPLPRSTGFARWGRWAEPDRLAVESLVTRSGRERGLTRSL